MATVAEYDFDGNANDSVAANNGTAKNTPTYGASLLASEPSGQAIVLNGTNQYVEIPDATAIRFGEGGLWLSFWLNLSKVTEAKFLLAKTTTAGEPDYAVNVNTGTEAAATIEIKLRNTSAETINFGFASGITYGAPHRIDVILDTTAQLARLLIDGVQKNTAAFTKPLSTGTGKLWLGSREAGGVRTPPGTFDKLRMRSGPATNAEVLAEYNADKAAATMRWGFKRDSSRRLVIKPGGTGKRRGGYLRTPSRSLCTATTGGVRSYGNFRIDALGRLMISENAIVRTRRGFPRDAAGNLVTVTTGGVKVRNGMLRDSAGRVVVVEGS